MPALLILMPLAGIMALNLLPRNLMRRSAFYFAAALFTIQIVFAVYHQDMPWSGVLSGIDTLFKFNLAPDHLSYIVLFSVGIVSLSSLIIAKYTIQDDKEQFKFINLLIISSIGMTGIIMVKDIFSLYVFLEITAVASFILIAFRKDILGLEGAFKYLMLSAVATILILVSIALLVLGSADTSFSAIRALLGQSQGCAIATLAVGLFLCGLLIKGGLVPFHGWLPDAYTSAPAPASILLAGITTKACGIYTIMRVVASVFGFDERTRAVLMLVGLASILVGAFAAFAQNDFKRMLAYSSISQVGYIILGAGTGTALGIAGAAFHLLNHAVFKSLLFVNSAALEIQAGTNDMNRMGGLAAKMPVTGTTSVIAMLSACGVPPLAGFWSKLIIVIALWQAAHYAYAVIAVMASVVTLGYFLYMQRQVFFGKLAEGMEDTKEAGLSLTLTASILAAITVGIGLFFPAVYNGFILPVKDILIH